MPINCFYCEKALLDEKAPFCFNCDEPAYDEETQNIVKHIVAKAKKILNGYCIECRFNTLDADGMKEDETVKMVIGEIVRKLNLEREIVIYRSLLPLHTSEAFDWIVVCRLEPNQSVKFDFDKKIFTLDDDSELQTLSYYEDGRWFYMPVNDVQELATGKIPTFHMDILNHDWKAYWQNQYNKIDRIFNGFKTDVTVNKIILQS